MNESFCRARKHGGTHSPCRKRGYPEYDGYCKQHFELAQSEYYVPSYDDLTERFKNAKMLSDALHDNFPCYECL